MLSGFPPHIDRRDRNARKAIVFHVNVCFLGKAVLEAGPEPGIDEAGNVYSRCCYEVVPVKILTSAIKNDLTAGWSYQEVSV